MESQSEWHLGQTSRKYETGGRGAGVVSTGRGDHGGVSYGSYQLSTNAGTLAEYLDRSVYKDQFAGMAPNTAAFNEKWVELAGQDPGFAKDQHAFVKETHYDIQQSKLKDSGLDLSTRGPAIQDLVWSTSVQFRNLTPRIFMGGLNEKFGDDYKLESLSDRQIVEAVQDYKLTHNNTLFSKSPTLWNGLMSRAKNEKADLVYLAEKGDQVIGPSPNQFGADATRGEVNPLLRAGQDGAEIHILQRSLNFLGFTDVDGRKLLEDGDFGHRTREAVETFQRDNGLSVDGIAGPRTLGLINQRLLARQEVVVAGLAEGFVDFTIANPSYPGHSLYKQAYEQIKAQGPQAFGLASEHEVRNAAGTLAFEAKVSGMQRIDHVIANVDATGLLAVQGALSDPAHHRIYVDRAQAATQSVERSSELLRQEGGFQVRQQAEAQVLSQQSELVRTALMH